MSTSSRRDSTLSISSSSGSEPSLMRGSELVRLSMMLQEASAISKSLNKPLVSVCVCVCGGRGGIWVGG